MAFKRGAQHLQLKFAVIVLLADLCSLDQTPARNTTKMTAVPQNTSYFVLQNRTLFEPIVSLSIETHILRTNQSQYILDYFEVSCKITMNRF